MRLGSGSPRRRRGIVAGIAIAFGCSATAGADDAPATAAALPVAAPAAAPASTNDQRDTQLAEVVVTATKRKQSLRDIPASITSISGEELQQRAAQGLQDIAKLVPGVNYTEDGQAPSKIAIRGVSAPPLTGATTGVLFGDVSFVDEYIPISTLDPNPFDLKSVDILKGPQGTLFGASALNGAIRYVPNAPRYGMWEASYYLDYTRFTDSAWKPNYGAVVNVPIGDRVALRVMGFERESPGWTNNVLAGVRNTNRVNQGGARAILGWEPVDELDVKLSYAWQNTHQADKSSVTGNSGSLDNTVSKRLTPTRVNYTLLDLNASYDLGFARLVSETANVHKASHLWADESYILEGSLPPGQNGAIPLLAVTDGGYSNMFSQELRLTSPESPNATWQWVAGLAANRQHVITTTTTPLGDSSIPIGDTLSLLNQILPQLAGQLTGGDAENGLINVGYGYGDTEIRDYAVFADVTRRFWSVVELELGGRLYQSNSSGDGVSGGVLNLGNGSVQTAKSAHITERGFNPKMSLTWHITPDIMTYASAAKGFRNGGMQPGSSLPLIEQAPPKTFQSDSIWNYESGIRTQWFHKTLRFDITAFYERWKRPQYNEPDASGLNTFLTNVGGVKSEGVEAALQVLLPLPGLVFSLTGAYDKAVITEPFLASSGNTAPVGTPWPFSPRWQTAATLAYIRDIGPLSLSSGLTHTSLSKAADNLYQSYPENAIFGYQTWDAFVSLGDKVHSWMPDLTVTVNNMFNARGMIDHVYSKQAPLTYDEVVYNTPRQITLRLSGHF